MHERDTARRDAWQQLNVRGSYAYTDLVTLHTTNGLMPPPVPSDLVGLLRAGRWTWSTTSWLDAFDTYVDPDLERLLDPRLGSYWTYGHSGHGVNSYAIGLLAKVGGILVAQQHAHGGAFMSDHSEAVNDANVAWAQLLQQLDTAEHDVSVIVLFSDYRGQAALLCSEEEVAAARLGVEDLDPAGVDGWSTVASAQRDSPLREQLAAVAPRSSHRLALGAQHLFRLVYPGDEVPEYVNRRRIR